LSIFFTPSHVFYDFLKVLFCLINFISSSVPEGIYFFNGQAAYDSPFCICLEIK